MRSVRLSPVMRRWLRLLLWGPTVIDELELARELEDLGLIEIEDERGQAWITHAGRAALSDDG